MGIILSPYDLELSSDPVGADVEITKQQSSLGSTRGARDNESRRRVVLEPGSLASCNEIVDAALNPRIARLYRLATASGSYKIAPRSIRSALLSGVMKGHEVPTHSGLEAVKESVTGLLRDSGCNLRERRRPMLIVTHDVDTEKGFRKAVAMKSIDEELGLKSIWFVPSDEYHLDQQTVRDLSDGSIIGSHDTKHDGRLILTKDRTKLVQRLRESRERVEYVFGKDVRCFRSPLLQFNRAILEGAREAGYDLDFSLPSWEPAHPSVMDSFGIEYFHSFGIGGAVEVPLSMLQDHQALYILGLSTKAAVSYYGEQAKFIRSFGGDLVLLVHPDYRFAEEPEQYKALLTSLLDGETYNFSDLRAIAPSPMTDRESVLADHRGIASPVDTPSEIASDIVSLKGG